MDARCRGWGQLAPLEPFPGAGDCPPLNQDTVEIESKRGSGGWQFVAVCFKRKHTDTRAPLAARQPEVREYRCRFRDGDVASVTTNP